MGYESDVVLCLSKNVYNNMLELIKTFDENEKNNVENFLYEASEKCLEGEDEVLFTWKNIELSDWEDFLELVNHALEDMSEFSFIRIGDDPYDIESEGYLTSNNSFIFYPVSKIHLEFSDSVKNLKKEKEPLVIL